MPPPNKGPAPREALAQVRAMSSPGAACAVDLSDNTNLFGVPPAATAVLREARDSECCRYPSPYSDALRQALASYHNVPAECVITGCGSDAVIDNAIRAFTEPGARIAFTDPTFSMIPVFARINGLLPAPVACAGAPDASVVRALFDSGARVVYLCSPNNPTGARKTQSAWEVALDRLNAPARPTPLLILDQAYAEFDELGCPGPKEHLEQGAILVTRTMSKAFGLAGLRVGYGVGPAEMIAAIEKVRGPYTVGAIAERAAVAALTHDLDWVQARAVEAIALRDRFIVALTALGFAPLPSAANFVLVPVKSAATTDAALRSAGVAVRAFEGITGIGDALRITIGPWPMLATCLAALKAVPR